MRKRRRRRRRRRKRSKDFDGDDDSSTVMMFNKESRGFLFSILPVFPKINLKWKTKETHQ